MCSRESHNSSPTGLKTELSGLATQNRLPRHRIQSKLFRICSCCSIRKTNLERWLCTSRDYSVGDGPHNSKDGHTYFVQLPGYMPGLLRSRGEASRNDKHLVVGLWRRFTCIRTLERPRLVSEGRRIWFLSVASMSILWSSYILRAN